MIYLLDTTAISSLMRENASVKRRAEKLRPPELAVTCAIVRGEIKHGVQRLPAGSKRAVLENKSAAVLGTIPCHSISTAVANHYAELRSVCEARGQPMGDNATLVSSDTDFRRIDGLRVED